MINTCAKNQGNRGGGGACISGVSVLQKVTLNIKVKSKQANIVRLSSFWDRQIRTISAQQIHPLNGNINVL